MNLLPFEYDKAFVRMMAGVTEVVEKAKRQAYTRWLTVFTNSIHNPETRMGQHLHQVNYNFEVRSLYIRKQMRRCLVIAHHANRQKCFVQLDLLPGFDIKPFLNGEIPRDQQLNCYFVQIKERGMWIFDPQEQFLESGRAAI